LAKVVRWPKPNQNEPARRFSLQGCVHRPFVLKMKEDEPKRLVVREVLERTMWLAYFERVARTLPEEFIELMPERPAPFLKYADVTTQVSDSFLHLSSPILEPTTAPPSILGSRDL